MISPQTELSCWCTVVYRNCVVLSHDVLHVAKSLQARRDQAFAARACIDSTYLCLVRKRLYGLFPRYISRSMFTKYTRPYTQPQERSSLGVIALLDWPRIASILGIDPATTVQYWYCTK